MAKKPTYDNPVIKTPPRPGKVMSRGNQIDMPDAIAGVKVPAEPTKRSIQQAIVSTVNSYLDKIATSGELRRQAREASAPGVEAGQGDSRPSLDTARDELIAKGTLSKSSLRDLNNDVLRPNLNRRPMKAPEESSTPAAPPRTKGQSEHRSTAPAPVPAPSPRRGGTGARDLGSKPRVKTPRVSSNNQQTVPTTTPPMKSPAKRRRRRKS